MLNGFKRNNLTKNHHFHLHRLQLNVLAPEKGADTRNKISDAVTDFCRKHNLKLSRKDVEDLVDDIKDAADED